MLILPNKMCAQQRLTSACASGQSDQFLFGTHSMGSQGPSDSSYQQQKLSSDYTNSYADLSLCWKYMSKFPGQTCKGTFSYTYPKRWTKELIWTTSWENLYMPYANNKDPDQPALPCMLISIFIIRCLDSIIPVVSIYMKFQDSS